MSTKEILEQCDKVELYSLLIDSFGILLNANDFFNWACADSVVLDPADLLWVLPIYKEHGQTGLEACMSYIAKQDPIKPHLTDEFRAIRDKITLLNPDVHSEY